MSSPTPSKWTIFKLAIIPIALLAIITLFLSMQTVPAGHVGVEKGFAGDTTGNELDPGTHFINPIHSVQNVECRPRTYTMAHIKNEGEKNRNDAVVVQSVNGTTHDVDVTIRYNIDCGDGKPTAFVDRWDNADQMEKRLIRPDARSDMRDEASDISFDVIYKKPGRERLAMTVTRTINSNFADEPVEAQAVKVRDVSIPPNLQDELEKKEQAKVRIETKQNEIQVEKKEAERKRIEAEADSDVIRIKGKALKQNEVVLKQRYIEALENGEAIYVVPDDGGNPVLLEAGAQGNTTASSSP